LANSVIWYLYWCDIFCSFCGLCHTYTIPTILYGHYASQPVLACIPS